MKPNISSAILAVASFAALAVSLSSAILVQPHNFMLDEHELGGGSMSPFYHDQSADKDIISILSDKLARLRDARMLEMQNADSEQAGQFSQEMADLIRNEHQQQVTEKQQDGQQEPSLSSSVANVLMNAVQAAASAADEQAAQQNQENHQSTELTGSGGNQETEMVSRGSIMELDTSGSSASSLPSKSDLKSGPKQWFNPKETIPVLKISSMATPSKYKKVYFRAEKKLVDGAFHSPNNEKDGKKTPTRPFSSSVQRRSSRGTSSSVPPGILQDGVIDFLKKFRDVYIQTRPANSASGSSLASSVVSAAASSPFAAVLSQSAGSRPNLASAISAATSMVSNAAQVAQAASSSAQTSGSSSGSSSATGTAAAAAAGAATGNKNPLTAQTYVSFWSKTFPTWVRKMLKQMRRRSLYNSNKRYKQHLQHSAGSSIGQAAQASASVANPIEQASSSASSSSSSSSGQTSH